MPGANALTGRTNRPLQQKPSPRGLYDLSYNRVMWSLRKTFFLFWYSFAEANHAGSPFYGRCAPFGGSPPANPNRVGTSIKVQPFPRWAVREPLWLVLALMDVNGVAAEIEGEAGGGEHICARNHHGAVDGGDAIEGVKFHHDNLDLGPSLVVQ